MSLDKSRANLIITHLNRLKQIYNKPLRIVETGTIRNIKPEYILGDGHSTHLIAQWIKDNGGSFFSIDQNIEVADNYLKELGLREHVQLLPYDSVTFLRTFTKNDIKLHLAYLDSGNDPNLILAEFQTIENMMLPQGVIIIDDCVPGSNELLKGNKAIPYAKEKGYRVELKERQGVVWF